MDSVLQVRIYNDFVKHFNETFYSVKTSAEDLYDKLDSIVRSVNNQEFKVSYHVEHLDSHTDEYRGYFLVKQEKYLDRYFIFESED